MLIAEINKSKIFGEKYRDSSVSEKQLKDIEHLRDEIVSVTPAINNILKNSKYAKKLGTDDLEEIQRLISQLKSLKNELKNIDRERIISELEELNYLKDVSEQKLEKVWADYKEENFSKNASIIHSLLTIIDNNEKIDKLEALEESIRAKKIGDSKTKEKIEQYQKISQEIIKDLKMSSNIENFIFRLSQGEELVLEDVTQEILSWLVQNKITSKIKISI